MLTSSHCFQTTILALVGTKNDLRWTEAERLMHDQNTKWVDQEMTDGLARHPLINSPRRSAVMLLCFRVLVNFFPVHLSCLPFRNRLDDFVPR